MAGVKVERIFQSDAEVAESPVWRAEDQSLYWIDIHLCTFNRFTPATGKNSTWTLPQMPGCCVLRDGGALIPSRDGIYDFDFANEKLTKIFDPPYDPDLYRFNDGKCDPAGRLWVGTQPLELSNIGKDKAALYRFDGAAIASMVEIDMANGLAFSSDAKTMYRAETARRTLYAYAFDAATGAISNERVFAQWERSGGAPDGATIDTDGGYWVALPAGEAGGAIARFTPDGKLDMRIDLPVPGPSMVAFGGADMRTLFVTSARFSQLADRPGSELSGSFFAVETGFQGAPEPHFVSRRKAS